jgi:hypothetical protein
MGLLIGVGHCIQPLGGRTEQPRCYGFTRPFLEGAMSGAVSFS